MPRSLQVALAGVLVLFAATRAHTGQISAERLAAVDAIFAEFDSTNSPGCALGVIRDGELVLERGYGMASLEHGVPNSASAVYYIGSTSKQFVAASILLAAEQGHLSLDDDIRQQMPELPEWEAPITIRHLVHHTSGLRDYLTLMFMADMSPEDVWRRDQIVDLLARQRALNFAPGEEYLYSNSGYFLMAEIVERATGKSLREFADEYIFQPLEMHRTHFHDERTMIVKNRAAAYRPADEGGFELSWFTNFEQVGSGGLLTTVRDLARWDDNFYDSQIGGGSLIEEMHRTGELNDGETLDYAAGLVLGEHRGLPTVQHGGAMMGFRAQLLRFPEERFSVICLCNTANANPGGRAIEVAELFLADRFEAAAATAATDTDEGEPETVQLSEEQLGRWVGAYREVDGQLFRKIRVEEGKLVYVRGDDNKTELAAVAEDRFVMVGVGARVEVEFQPIEGNARPRMIVTVPGDDGTTFDPVDAATPEPDVLAAYEGRYYSAELDIVFRIEIEESGLVARAGSNPETHPLEPTVIDEFSADGPMIRFRRDGDEVTGFTVDAGRVRNIVFERQPTGGDE